jgi:hypothetical protein
MNCIALTWRLGEAGDLVSILGAAYDAFEETMSAIWSHEETTGNLSAALVFAAAAAADGRDAIATAPSLPRTKYIGVQPPRPDQRTPELTTALAALSAVLAARLTQAAESATEYQDRGACQIGARQALQIHSLLTGNEP